MFVPRRVRAAVLKHRNQPAVENSNSCELCSRSVEDRVRPNLGPAASPKGEAGVFAVGSTRQNHRRAKERRTEPNRTESAGVRATEPNPTSFVQAKTSLGFSGRSDSWVFGAQSKLSVPVARLGPTVLAKAHAVRFFELSSCSRATETSESLTRLASFCFEYFRARSFAAECVRSQGLTRKTLGFVATRVPETRGVDAERLLEFNRRGDINLQLHTTYWALFGMTWVGVRSVCGLALRRRAGSNNDMGWGA